MSVAPVLLLVAAQVASSASGPVTGLPLEGEAAEEFLRTAEVVELQQFDNKGITRPRKATLSDGERTYHAVFKDVDIVHDKTKLTTGKTLFKLKDSYKHEIAAYELDVLLGLNIVPPCVERTIRGEIGSLCLWVENAMTEAVRKKKRIRPPDVDDWNCQMFTIRLFHQLIWDPDYNNIRNTLVDTNFKLYKVDSSMTFRTDPELRNEKSLTRFSRSVLANLESLERGELGCSSSPRNGSPPEASLRFSITDG